MVAKLLAFTYVIIMDMVHLHYSRCIYPVVFLIAILAATLSAQVSPLEGKRIATIQFIPREQPVEASELNEILPLKIGQRLRMATVDAAIQRLFATGRYHDIEVEAEPAGNEVVIRFLTTNNWFIGRVNAIGNISEPPNSGQLVNATRLDLGQPYTPDKLQTAEAGVKTLLDSNGLYRSEYRPQFDYDPRTQQINLRFIIDSGPRARLTTPGLKGELLFPQNKIISATGWRRFLIGGWKTVTQMRVRQGMQGVLNEYQKADRLEAKVKLDSMNYNPATNRAKPVLDVTAGPKVEIRTIGLDLSRKTLKRYVPVYQENTVDRDLLVEGARNLKNYLQSEGYFNAEVEFKQQRVIKNRAEIDFLINRGRRHKLVAIEISGNHYFSTETIRERMYLRTASFLRFRQGRFSEDYLRADENAIQNLYQSNGFRDVTVTSTVQENYHGVPGNLAVFISVNEGPQWYVAHLEVVGIHSLDEKQIVSTLSSVAGEPFSDFNVAVDRDTIMADYFTQGFPNATFEWNSTPAAQPNQVNLRYVITEKNQEFVREVLIDGLETTNPNLVYRNLLLNPGDPLSITRMTDTQRRMYDLGIFSKVDTAIQNPDGETKNKYVLYQMYEASKYYITGGVGAQFTRIGSCQTCLEAPVGQAGFAPRVSLDITRMNLWGLGHSASFRTRLSTLDSRILLDYLWPRFRTREGLSVAFTAQYEKSNDINTFAFTRAEGSAQLQQKVSKTLTMFYRYTYRYVTTNPATLKISPLLIPQASQPVRIGIISQNLIYDRRDDPIDPHHGMYNTMDLGLAEHFLGSQTNFLRFLGRNATYHPVTKNSVIARQTTFGVLHPFTISVPAGDLAGTCGATATPGCATLQAIPLPERFFGGGDNTNRGFPYYQAGPRDLNTGFPLGGTALFFNQTEFRFPLIGENIGGVLFHDAGNIYSSIGTLSFRVSQKSLQDFDYMVHAVGFGLRYHTPIGPLRVDFAYSINPPNFFGFKGTYTDFLNAGVNPCQTFPDRCTVQNVSHFQFFFSIGQTF